MQSGALGAMRWRTLAVAVVIAGAISAYFYFHPRSIEVRESQPRERLIVFRVVLEEYAYDKQKAPRTLQDLLQEQYLCEVPIDPITGSNSTWRLVPYQGSVAVKSGSTKTGLNGLRYSEW